VFSHWHNVSNIFSKTIKTIFGDSEFKNKNLKLLGTRLNLLGAPNLNLLPTEGTT
jgi:hypothetical protein